MPRTCAAENIRGLLLEKGADGAIDTYVFSQNWGTDFVYDFENGVDKFDMTASGMTSFGQFLVSLGNGHTQLSFNGNLIIVVNSAGQIDPSDFIF